MKRAMKYIFTAVLALIFVVYILYHLLINVKSDAKLYTIDIDTLSEKIDVNGIVIREAKTTYSTNTGYFSYVYDDGSKIGKNTTVAYTYPTTNKEIELELEKIASQLYILERSVLSRSDSLTQIDKDIEKTYSELSIASSSGEYKNVDSLQNELAILTNKRLLITQNKDNFNNEIANLNSRKSQLLSRLGSNVETITLVDGGYFYHKCDGLDDLINTSLLKELNFSTYDKVMSYADNNISSASNVVGTLVTNTTWYYAFRVDTNDILNLAYNKSYEVTFNSNQYTNVVKMTVDKIIRSDDNREAIVVLSSNIIPTGFEFTRIQHATIKTSSFSGYKIPSSCVRFDTEKSEQYVFIFKKGFARKRVVVPIYESDGYYLIKTDGEIQLYDRIILGDKDLFDGKIID